MPVNIARLSQVLNQAADRSRVAHAMQHTHWLVYGAGRAGHQWATALSHAGRTIHGFLDNRVTTSHLAPVFPPANCPNTLREQCAVLLALHNPSVDVAAVRRNLHAAGHKYVWLLTDLIDAFPQLSHFWLAPAEETLQYAEAITTGFNALADDTSRELLLSTLDQRLNSHTDNLPTPSPSTQYCPVDIPPPPPIALYRLRGLYRRHHFQFISPRIELRCHCGFRAQSCALPAALRSRLPIQRLSISLRCVERNDAATFFTGRCCQLFRRHRLGYGSNRYFGSSTTQLCTQFDQDGYRGGRVSRAPGCTAIDCNVSPTSGHQRVSQAPRPLGIAPAGSAPGFGLPIPPANPRSQRLRYRALRDA